MAITADNQKVLNGMCPGANRAGLGDAISDIYTQLGTLVSGTVAYAAVKAAIGAANSALGLNSQKITGLANGTLATDAAAFGQIAAGITYTAVKAAIGAANSALGLNSQKITGLAAGTAATDAAVVSQAALSVTATPGVSTGGFTDVVCAIVDAGGNAAGASAYVVVQVIAPTDGATKGAIAAASIGVGSLLVAQNPAAGSHFASFQATAGGLFSFKVSDDTAETVVIKVSASGAAEKVIAVAISGP